MSLSSFCQLENTVVMWSWTAVNLLLTIGCIIITYYMQHIIPYSKLVNRSLRMQIEWHRLVSTWSKSSISVGHAVLSLTYSISMVGHMKKKTKRCPLTSQTIDVEQCATVMLFLIQLTCETTRSRTRGPWPRPANCVTSIHREAVSVPSVPLVDASAREIRTNASNADTRKPVARR